MNDQNLEQGLAMLFVLSVFFGAILAVAVIIEIRNKFRNKP